MNRRPRPVGSTIPFVAYLRAGGHDRLARALVYVIACASVVLLALPFNSAVQRSAIRRFHQSQWNRAAWMLLQPMPSMYNFENRWQVTFISPPEHEPRCAERVEGYINHHVVHRLLLPAGRALFVLCGPAHVRFRTTYRDVTLTTRYTVARRQTNGRDGLVVTREPR